MKNLIVPEINSTIYRYAHNQLNQKAIHRIFSALSPYSHPAYYWDQDLIRKLTVTTPFRPLTKP